MTDYRQSITVYNAEELAHEQQGACFSFNLFADFVTYIDRSERTTRTYLINLRQFAAWLNFEGITSPVRNDIVLYREWLDSEHKAIEYTQDEPQGWKYRTDRAGNHIKIKCKAATIKLYLQSVKQFFKWTASEGLYPDIAQNIHAPKVKADTHKKDALTAAEVLKIENSIVDHNAQRAQEVRKAEKDTAGRIQRNTEQGKRLFAMYQLATNAGLRCIELHRANIKDLETKGGRTVLYIWGKGCSEPEQKKIIAPEVADAINDYIKSRTDRPTGSSPLFVSTGNRSHGKRIATTTISTMLKKALQEAGFDSQRLTAHSLRHSCGTATMKLTHNNIFETQHYMRHSDPKTTEIYSHIDTEELNGQLAGKLYNYYHGIDEEQGGRSDLIGMIDKLTPEQVKQLTALAAAMA